jgi:hypothetical protein
MAVGVLYQELQGSSPMPLPRGAVFLALSAARCSILRPLPKLHLSFVNLSKADRERLTREAMARGDPLIYGGRISGERRCNEIAS